MALTLTLAPTVAHADSCDTHGCLAAYAEVFVLHRGAWPSFQPTTTAARPQTIANGQFYRPSGTMEAVGVGVGTTFYTPYSVSVPFLGLRVGALTSTASYSSMIPADPQPVRYDFSTNALYASFLLPGIGLSWFSDRVHLGIAAQPNFSLYGGKSASLTQGVIAQAVDTTGGTIFEVGTEAEACLAVGERRGRQWLCLVAGAPLLRTDPLRAFDGATISLRFELTYPK